MPSQPFAPSRLDALLSEVFGFNTFRGFQREAIDHVMAGGDALVLMPTGGGKSLCYQLPSLARQGVGVVVSPLIALMQDQVSALAQLGVRAAFLNSTLSSREAWAVEQRVREGALDLLYVAPERLLMDRTLALLEASTLALFAIDEAHCVSQWGHDFRPEYGQLSVLRERFAHVPRIALTATADAPTRQEIAEKLLVGPRIFVASFDRPNIRYRIVDKRDGRKQLLDFIRAEHVGDDDRCDSGIVYCLARATVEEVAAMLQQHGLDALPYHAGLDPGVRRANQARFLRDDGVIMVATIAFGMGIDKPDVRFVAHIDMPKSIEGYFQETGRGGRDGAPAQAWMTYGLADVVQQRRLIEQSEADIEYKRLSATKLDAMLALCETAGCRRERLLAYFGEAAAPCGNCDNCLEPPAVWDATDAARKLLSCIYRCEQHSGFPFAATHIIDVLRGRSNEKVEKFRHMKLSTFGIGAELSETDWRLVLRQLVAHHLVEVDAERFNVLRLTAASRAVLRGEQRVTLRRHDERPVRERKRRRDADSATAAAASPLSATDKSLFERLRQWRADTAKAQGVPAYVVFHDSQLRALAQARPASREALRGLPGLGEKKLASYGDQLVALVTGAVGRAASSAHAAASHASHHAQPADEDWPTDDLLPSSL